MRIATTVSILYRRSVLAPLLISIKKVGYCNLSLSLTITCGHNNLKKFSCILPKFVMHVRNDQFSDNPIMAEKIQNDRFIELFRILHL